MANNYCQWSEYISLNNKEEADWMKDVLHLNASKYETPEDENLDDSEVVQKILSKHFGIELSVDDTECFPGFSHNFHNDQGAHIYAEEFGDIGTAAIILQAFLKKFRPNEYFSVQWADTCSKPRAGEFGGGAVFITANNLEWMHTGDWVSKQEVIFQQKV